MLNDTAGRLHLFDVVTDRLDGQQRYAGFSKQTQTIYVHAVKGQELRRRQSTFLS